MPFRWLSRRWSGDPAPSAGSPESLQLNVPGSGTARPLPAIPWVKANHLTWWPVEHLARFWDPPPAGSGSQNLGQATFNVVKGLQKQNFAFLMWYHQGNLQVGWLAESHSPLKGLLESSYPGIATQGANGGLGRLLDQLPHFKAAIQVSGNPANPGPQEPTWQSFDPPSLDRLVQGLTSYTWLYVVMAFPPSPAKRQALLDDVFERETEIQAAYLRSGTALEKNNPQAQAWLQQVQAEKARLEEGLRTGLWDTLTLLYLEEPEALGVAASLLRSLFAGPESNPQAIKLGWYLAGLPGAGGAGTFTPTVLCARDLANLMLPPQQSYQGYPVRPFTNFDRHQTQAKKGRQLFLGKLVSPPAAPVYLNIQDLPKHLLIAGTTGSGKTNACLSILYQAWKLHQIPFMVLETSEKSEYAAKLRHLLADELECLTVGDESRRPLHLDLLQVPAGVSVEAHMGHLREIFKAAFTLPPPTPILLDEALHLWYTRRGWDLEHNQPPPGEGRPLVFADLVGILEDLLATKYKRYDSELRGNIEGALLARLGSLNRGSVGKFFHSPSRTDVSWEHLVHKPVVLELGNITDREQKALALLYLLYRIRSSAREHQRRFPERLHLTVVEEAHQVLAQQEVSKHPEVADTAGAAMQAFAEALRLLREYREGFIILDQMPSLLSPAVRGNTNLKLAFRLPMEEEQRVIAQSAGLDANQQKLLYRLAPGEALWSPADGGIYHIGLPEFPPQ